MAARKAAGFAILLFGVVLFVLGVIMGPWLATYLNGRFKKAGQGVCDVEDLNKESFLDPYSDCDDCTPLHYGYHPFHLSNAEQYLSDPVNTKPILEEKGPYFFRNNEIRVDARLDGDFVSFKSYDKWMFDEGMSTGKETDVVTKMDLGYLSVTTSTGGELNFINSLLTGLMAMRGQAVDVDVIPRVVKANFMRLINGLNSFDPATMLRAVSELGPLFRAETDVPTYMTELAAKSFDGFYYNGVFSQRTVKQWFMGQPSFIAGLALGSQYPSCAAPQEAAGGMSMLKICETCTGTELEASQIAVCHKYWRECSTCRKANAIKASSDALCDVLEAQLTSSLDAAQAALVVGATCRLCATTSLFCLAQLPGEVETSGLDYNVVPVDESRLGRYKVDQGCSDVRKQGHHEVFASSTATAIWKKLAPGQTMPSVFDLMQFSSQSWCDSDVQDGVTCMAFPGNDAKAFAPGGVKIRGLEEDAAFESHDVFVTQVMFNVSVAPTEEEVETNGIKLTRLMASGAVLDRVPWNEHMGVGFPVDGVACAAFRKGFLAFVSRPMFAYADTSLLDRIELVTRAGVRVTRDTPVENLLADYETFVDVQAAAGVAMNGRKRLMGSVALTTEAVPGSTASTANLVHPTMPANVLLPIYWVEERATITEHSAEKFRAAVRLSRAMAPVCGVGVGVGLLCFTVGAVILLRSFQPPAPASSAGSDARDVETASQPSTSSVVKAKEDGKAAQPVARGGDSVLSFPVQLTYTGQGPAPLSPPFLTNVPLVRPSGI